MDKLKHVFALLLLWNAGTLFAQASAPNSIEFTETVSAQLNATVFVSGETLYYKVNCLNGSGKPSAISRMAYAELVSSDRKAVFTHKFFIEDGSAQGDFFIPAALPTGSYKFIAYTYWMLDQPATGYFQADITIINPFVPASKKAGQTASAVSSAKENAGGISISAPNTTATRSKTQLKINVPQPAVNGSYVLSVRKKDALSGLSGKLSANSGNRFRFSSRADRLPELRGELITGKVLAKDGTPVAGASVALSIPGKTFAVKIAKADLLGNFSITLEKPYYNKEVIVQALGPNRADLVVSLDPEPHPDYSGLEFNARELTAELENTIREHSVASQVENAYYMHRADTLARVSSPAPFYAALGKSFVLDQYTRFPTFSETIIEVVENAYFTKNGNSYTLHAKQNSVGGEISAQALVVIDGIYIQDASELFDYPAKNIEKITVVPGTYYYGPNAYSGVISIETFNGDYTPKASGSFLVKTEMSRPLRTKKYFAPDYAALPNARIPDHRMQLVWQPELSLPQTETIFSFYTSDISGTFEAVIEGFTQNGDAVFATAEFEVK